ncbi:MAG: hypothetical protein PUP92_15390 [Rhizonema sp. PD38]|nr:hypothetical protein [Rhizonema sp. PD38]
MTEIFRAQKTNPTVVGFVKKWSENCLVLRRRDFNNSEPEFALVGMPVDRRHLRTSDGR